MHAKQKYRWSGRSLPNSGSNCPVSAVVNAGRAVVIDYEFLVERQNETVIKELCMASAAASQTFRFKSPYKMADDCSIENRINWTDVYIEYRELHTVINETVAGFAHLYA